MRKYLILLFFVTFNIYGSINDYIYPSTSPTFSNYGTLGLIQNPNARFHKEGTLALAWSHNYPYLRGSLIGYPFNWVEVSYQYADINNALYSQVKEFSGNQSLKDKSFDAKFKVLDESFYLPQVAIGFRDLAGTGLFSSEYIVGNKNIKNFDISLGIGWGILDQNKISNPLTNIADRFQDREIDTGQGGKFNFGSFFSGSAGLFGGVEYFLPKMKGARIKLEYDATNYIKEGVEPIKQNSRVNIGIVYPYSKNLMLKASFIRGNTFGFGFSYKLHMGNKNPIVKKKEKYIPQENSKIIQRVTSRSDQNLYRASLLYLSRNGLNLQKASIEDSTLKVVYANPKFSNPVISSGRALRVLNEIAPSKINKLSVAEVNGGLGLFEAEIDRGSLDRSLKYKDPSLLYDSLEVNPFKYNRDSYEFNPKANYPKVFHTISPDLRSQIGGPDGFFFGDLKLTLQSQLLFSNNLHLSSVMSYGLYDNMGELKLASDSILPHVRTDIVQYLKQSRGYSIRRLQLNYFKQPHKSIYYKLSAGIFESMFGGLGGEILYRPFERNFGIGAELWQAYQRDYDQLFSFRDYNTTTGHITFYIHEPKTHLLFKLKGGKYLARDSGITLDISRRFRSGVTFGGFFSLTDISEEEFGEGSFDKGFYFWIPVDIFSPRYYKRTFGWGLRPLTRDGAANLIHGYPLWGVTDQVSRYKYQRKLYDIFD